MGTGQMRLQGREAGVAIGCEGSNGGVQFAVAFAGGNNFACSGDRILDLQVFKVGAEQCIALGVRLDAYLDEVGVVPSDPQRLLNQLFP